MNGRRTSIPHHRYECIPLSGLAGTGDPGHRFEFDAASLPDAAAWVFGSREALHWVALRRVPRPRDICRAPARPSSSCQGSALVALPAPRR